MSRILDTLVGVDVADVEIEEQVIVAEDPIRIIGDEAADCDFLIMGGAPDGWRGKSREDSFPHQVAETVGITSVAVLSRDGGRESWLRRLPMGTE